MIFMILRFTFYVYIFLYVSLYLKKYSNLFLPSCVLSAVSFGIDIPQVPQVPQVTVIGKERAINARIQSLHLELFSMDTVIQSTLSGGEIILERSWLSRESIYELLKEQTQYLGSIHLRIILHLTIADC